MSHDGLREREHLVLLASSRLEPPAHGVPIVKALLGVVLPVLLAGFTTLSAQTRPNLTGTWLNLSDPNATDVKTASNLPNALLTIVHAGDRFDLERSWSNAPIKEAHVCNGQENKNGYSSVVERTTCRWDAAGGGTLIIEGTIGRADGEVVGRLRQTYRLDADGVLLVERMREITAGPVTPTGPRTYTQRYRKVPAGRMLSSRP
jgi:hypothetical protein